MIHREDGGVFFAITQPTHSWVSGQLARLWGNEQFGHFAPLEEVCLAAEQHDIGFLEWEASPSLNTRTGRPHSFLDMPTAMHLEIWVNCVQKMLGYHRYAALLVSLHTTTLCENFQKADTPEKKILIDGFLTEQKALQSELIASLISEATYSDFCGEAAIFRNQRLIATWDYISLILCFGVAQEHQVMAVPTTDNEINLTVRIPRGNRNSAIVDPWPFKTSELNVLFEARRIPNTFATEEEMRLALKSANAISFPVTLSPR